MLKLTRQRGEGFTIGAGIRIKVLKVVKGIVHIGIDAPKDQVIARDDVDRKNAGRRAGVAAQETSKEVCDAPVDP